MKKYNILIILLVALWIGDNSRKINNISNSTNENNIVINVSEQKINFNSCSKKDLMELSGIGEEESNKIIENRPYKSKIELIEKGVMSLETLEKNKDKIEL